MESPVADDPRGVQLVWAASMANNSVTDAALAQLIQRLHDRFPLIGLATIEQVVSDLHRAFDGCRIREFIPLLIERESRNQLSDLSSQAALTSTPAPLYAATEAATRNLRHPGYPQSPATIATANGHQT